MHAVMYRNAVVAIQLIGVRKGHLTSEDHDMDGQRVKLPPLFIMERRES